ncbi:hypothetical protein ACJJTC_016047 [Scirpophaga incertulas]
MAKKLFSKPSHQPVGEALPCTTLSLFIQIEPLKWLSRARSLTQGRAPIDAAQASRAPGQVLGFTECIVHAHCTTVHSKTSAVFDARIIINEHALFLLYLGAISNYICSTNTAAISNDIRVVQAEIIFRVELAVPFAKGVVHSDLNTEGVAAYGFDLAPGLQDAIVGVVEATISSYLKKMVDEAVYDRVRDRSSSRASSVTDITATTESAASDSEASSTPAYPAPTASAPAVVVSPMDTTAPPQPLPSWGGG